MADNDEMATINRLVIMKAVVETFSDLLASCETNGVDVSGYTDVPVLICIICKEPIDRELCSPGCTRDRATRALKLLVGK